MGMPVNSENRRQIAADGTIFEVMEDGSIKRIGKLSADGRFEPFKTLTNWNCPKCGTENVAENNFCGKCGTKKLEVNSNPIPQSSVKKCAKCGMPLSDEVLFCYNCGAKRKKCCGEFLDAGFKFCPKCGKPAEGEESNEYKDAKPVKQGKTEEEIMLDPDNYIDKGDYIELVHPVGNIRMIQKDWIKQEGWLFSYSQFDWEEAMNLAGELIIGGFRDWRIPTIEELKIIYKIKDVCGIGKNGGWFWSSSTNISGSAWLVNFGEGEWAVGRIGNNGFVRCVR